MGIKIVRMGCFSDEHLKCSDFSELKEKYGAGIMDVAEELVKIDIIHNKWYFDGNYHQNGKFGTYVFMDSDGKEYVWLSSMRSFGNTMSEAWNKIDETNSYDYSDFYMGIDERDHLYHVPKSPTEFLGKNTLDSSSIPCCRCYRQITQSEYSTNFGLCNKCLTEDYDDYMKKEIERDENKDGD